MRFNETGKNKELFELLNVMKEKYAKGKAKIDGVSEVIDFEEIRQSCEKGNNETIKACVEDVEEIQARFVAVGQAYEEALKAIDELKDKLIEKEIFGSSQGKSLS